MDVRLRLARWQDVAAHVGRTDVLALVREVRDPVPLRADKSTRKAVEVERRQPVVEVAGRVRWGRGGDGRLEFVVDGAHHRANVVWTEDERLAHATVSANWFGGPVEVWLGSSARGAA